MRLLGLPCLRIVNRRLKARTESPNNVAGRVVRHELAENRESCTPLAQIDSGLQISQHALELVGGQRRRVDAYKTICANGKRSFRRRPQELRFLVAGAQMRELKRNLAMGRQGASHEPGEIDDVVRNVQIGNKK